MPRRRNLPPDLLAAPFRTAEARARGIGDRRLRAPDVVRPFHGLGMAAGDRESIAELCDAYAPRLLPGQVFSHTTALALWSAPLPRKVEHEIHLSVAFPRTPPRTIGVTGHALRVVDPVMVRGLPTSGAAAAWCEAASFLARDELVAAGDALVTGRRIDGVRGRGATDPEELAAAMRRRRRLRGAEAARWALARIRSGVDSAGETRLRLLLADHGLPDPEVDVAVDVGSRVLHADIGWSGARIALDYEGDGHRTDRRQWMRDVRRHELFEDVGFRHIRVVAGDLRDPRPLIARLRRLLGERRSR